MIVALAVIGGDFFVPLLVTFNSSTMFGEPYALEVDKNRDEDDIKIADDCSIDYDDQLEIDPRDEDYGCCPEHKDYVNYFASYNFRT